MKYAISFFIVLLLIVSGLIFFQFQVYSNNPDVAEEKFSYTQEIEINYRGDSLDIRQHFKNLPNKEINIKWPNHAINPDCFIESEQTCERISEDKTKFNASDARSQSVSYVIPLDGGLKSKQLMKDIFVTLQNGTVTYSTVHITTDSNLGGQWVTGLPLIGEQSLTLVNYVMFSGPGNISEMYWQQDDMDVQYTSDIVSIYSSTKIDKQLNDQLENMQFLSEEHFAIVQGNNLSNEQGKRILFVKDLSGEGLNNSIFLSQVDSLYDFGDSPSWVKEVVAAFLSGSIAGENKASQIVNTLMNEMSDAQLESWLQKLQDLKGSKITSTVLDKLLSETLNMHTDYFVSNETTEGVYPLLFTDDRKLYVNQNMTEDVKIVYKDGLLYYSSKDILNLLGYEVSEGPNGYYVDNKLRSFRFPEEYNFYVFNQRRFDIISNPFIEIASEKFIEEAWLQRLFLVEIEKTENEIYVSPITTLE